MIEIYKAKYCEKRGCPVIQWQNLREWNLNIYTHMFITYIILLIIISIYYYYY